MPESKYSRKGAQGCTCTLPHKGLVWLWFCFSLNPKALGNPRLKKKQNKTNKPTDFSKQAVFHGFLWPPKFHRNSTACTLQYIRSKPPTKNVLRFVKYLTTPHYEKQRKIIIQWKRRVHFGIEKRSNIMQKVGAISQNNWKMQGITS